MASWKLCVEDYGKIKSAEIEIAPLTLFVGDNNSGKSYLLSLLWGIENLGIDAILGEDLVKTEEYSLLIEWIGEQIKTAIRTGEHLVSVVGISGLMETYLNFALKKNKNSLVKTIFNSNQMSIGRITIELGDLSDINLKFHLTDTGGLTMSVKNCEWNCSIGDSIVKNIDLWRQSYVLEFLLKGIYGMLMNISMGDNQSNKYIYLPAARTGFMLTKDIIDKVGRKNTFNISSDKEVITPFVRPINQFLDVMGDMSLEKVGSKESLKLVGNLEKEMADGTVEISTIPNKEVQYIPNGYKNGIPLRLTSAVVTELSPLILILKHINGVKRFYYEEPEMCLHPQLQYKMGKIICRAVNSGMGMTITTHSDIILQHINNMIKLPKHKYYKEICEKLGYTEQDFLLCDQVKVYQLESKSRGKTEVKELLCGEDGYIVPTFNNALDKIMDEAYEIQG